MKKNNIIVLCAVLFTISAIAVDPNFELWNKTEYTIKVEVAELNNIGAEETKKISIIEPDGKFHIYEINTKQKTSIKITDPIFEVLFMIYPRNSDQETIYLSYDYSSGLRPQKGKWYGILGKTMSGYDITKNIRANQILLVHRSTSNKNIPRSTSNNNIPRRNEQKVLKDYYKILGISKNANTSEIKKTYRSLILRWHPDKNPNNKEESEAKSKELNEAYEILGDQEKRMIYDAAIKRQLQ